MLHLFTWTSGATNGYLRLLMVITKQYKLSNILYICPMHPCIVLKPNNATLVASYKFKRVYNENFQFLHKVHEVEQDLIQKVVTAVNEYYIKEMKNHTTGKFTYLLSTYKVYSLIQLNNIKKEVIEMNYYSITPLDNLFKKVKDLFDYGNMEMYS